MLAVTGISSHTTGANDVSSSVSYRTDASSSVLLIRAYARHRLLYSEVSYAQYAGTGGVDTVTWEQKFPLSEPTGMRVDIVFRFRADDGSTYVVRSHAYMKHRHIRRRRHRRGGS